MCIIISKPKNVDFPNKEILRNCFDNNPDGAGLMYVLKGKVQIHKGFMDFDKFYDYVCKLGKIIDLNKQAVVMHFRISTSGNVDAGNCHPYPISSKEKLLRKEHVVTDLGMAHNGIITDYSYKTGVLNDTQYFVRDCVAPIYELNHNMLNSKAIVALLEKIAGSKLCFLDKDENITMIGNFVEENGVFYSNTTYKAYSYYGYSSAWSKYGLYEDYYGSYDRDYDEIVEDKVFFNQEPLTENEFEICLDNLVFLGRGDLVICDSGTSFFRVAQNDVYAIDTYFNMYYVDYDKHDIVLMYENVELDTELSQEDIELYMQDEPNAYDPVTGTAYIDNGEQDGE